MSESHEHCKQHDDGVGGLPGPGRNLTITGFVFVTVLLASFLAPFAALNDSLLSYLSIVWWAV
ncbi:MAG: hypothetical protein HKP32_12120, partial [Woeseia sp.]|nr:hypothetical protein [Woeseia sp.]NNL55889.1 hypothetical protein [Woeseia sp.]